MVLYIQITVFILGYTNHVYINDVPDAWAQSRIFTPTPNEDGWLGQIIWKCGYNLATASRD